MLNRYGVSGEHYRDQRTEILVHARKTDDLAEAIYHDEPAPHELMRWEAKDLQDWSNRDDLVYLITTAGYVKIGVAKNPVGRMNDMQVGCPTELLLWGLIKPGRRSARSLEFDLHRRFAEQRVRGEWFLFSVLKNLKLSLSGPRML